MPQMPGVCKKTEELETAQQTKPRSVPGRGKPDRIESENNVRRGGNRYFTLSEFWGEGL